MKRLEKWEKIAQNLTDHVSEPAVLLRIVNSDFADLGDNDKILVVMFLCGVINQDNKTLGRNTPHKKPKDKEGSEVDSMSEDCDACYGKGSYPLAGTNKESTCGKCKGTGKMTDSNEVDRF